VQKNSGQNNQGGFAFGNQSTWKLLCDMLGLFVKAQAVFAWDLKTGRDSPSRRGFSRGSSSIWFES
jgi:hypothetical protein